MKQDIVQLKHRDKNIFGNRHIRKNIPKKYSQNIEIINEKGEYEDESDTEKKFMSGRTMNKQTPRFLEKIANSKSKNSSSAL